MPDTISLAERAPGSAAYAVAPAPLAPVERRSLPDAVTDRLFFAMVREDSTLDVEHLAPRADEEHVVVGSGGCTALSLLAAGAGRVWSVDLNRTQHHLVELKLAALRAMPWRDAAAFLGAVPMDARERVRRYAGLRSLLGDGARAWWDGREGDIGRGVLATGVSERFIAAVVAAVRLAVHPAERIERLLACRTLDEQRALYHAEWNSRRWRLLFHLLLNRAAFRRTYDPAFFRHVENPSFPRHFHALVERGLTEQPIATNWFAHHMLTGRMPVDVRGGAPPYLEAGDRVAARADRLALVDGGMTTFLRTRPTGSIAGFALSNIGEWLDAAALDALFAEIVRTARPGARVVIRDFVGHTDVPVRWRARMVEDRARSDALSRRDRSLVQTRITACHVVEDVP
jgi:S-adenosylmethionine-diacylglycerol 3-amino-3-carboxypropyl transferase